MSDALAEMQRIATSGLCDAIGAEVFRNGARLRCEKCGREQAMTSRDAGRYLASGWPECCGYTMTLERTP